jgi:hypothetical protein
MADEASEIRAQVKEARARLEQDLDRLDEISLRRRAGLTAIGALAAVALVALAAGAIVRRERSKRLKAKRGIIRELLDLLD